MNETPVKTTSVEGMEVSKEEFDQLSSAGMAAKTRRLRQKQALKAEEAKAEEAKVEEAKAEKASKVAGKQKAKEGLNNTK